MNKKYFTVASLAVLAIAIGGLVSGCALYPADNSENNNSGYQKEQQPAPTVEEQNQQPAPADVTESDVDSEIKDLDASMDTVKTSGFEANSLNDKDLGL